MVLTKEARLKGIKKQLENMGIDTSFIEGEAPTEAASEDRGAKTAASFNRMDEAF